MNVSRPGPRLFPIGIRLAGFVLPAVLLGVLILLDHFVLEPSLPGEIAHLVMFLLGVAGIAAFTFAIFDRLAELQIHEREQRQHQAALAEALSRRGRQLQALNQAGLSLTAELESSAVLQKIVELARDVANSKYAALGIFNENGEVVQFLTSGITREQRERIGPLPRGRGLLGLLQDEQRPIRARAIADHPASVGFPANHPPMGSFLGVPILLRGRPLGNLYLTEKLGEPEFSDEDEEAIVTLAAQAAIAIDNARLYERAGRVSVLEERQRIGMELHDGTMQSLYGVGLLLEDAADRMAGPPEARAGIDRAVQLLNDAIAEMRRYVMGLRPVRGAERPLTESLPSLASQIGVQAKLAMDVEVDPDAERELDAQQREMMFYVAADALTNVARHARAAHVRVRFGREGDSAVLEVWDDGIGFDVAARRSGLGIRNMRQRAFVAGAKLEVGSDPGHGTRIRIEMPLGSEIVAGGVGEDVVHR